MKYFVIFLVLVGFSVTVFAEDMSGENANTKYACNRPICLIEDENDEKTTPGLDYVIKMQVEPETKFTARVFDPNHELMLNESVVSDSDGIARIVYPVPEDANGDYEITISSYATKGAVHTGMLLRIGDRLSPSEGSPRIIHAHVEHDDHTYNPLVVDKQINMRLITNYKFENDTSLSLEFTIYGPDGMILEQGTLVNEKENTARHHFMVETDGLYTIVAKSDEKEIPEHTEKFGVLKSHYIIKENSREYPIRVSTMDEPTIAVNDIEFNKNTKKLTFGIEPTWSIFDYVLVELPYGLLEGPYEVFVNGQLQDMDSNSGYPSRIFLRGDLIVLSIPLEHNSSKVEIIGTSVFPQTSDELTVNSKKSKYNAGETLTIHGTSIPEENLSVKVLREDGSVALSDTFVSGLYGTFEHDILVWPEHSLDFPDGRYTIEVSNPTNQERTDTMKLQFQNRYDFFSGFQQIPVKDQLQNFEFSPTKIACKDGLILVIKNTDDSPACVYPETATKLSERGRWNVIEHKVSVSWFDAGHDGIGNHTVQVVDSRMNMSPETVEHFDVYVWSDSNTDGIELRVTETGENTNTFEGSVLFSDASGSTQDRLLVLEGDTVWIFHKNMVDSITVNQK